MEKNIAALMRQDTRTVHVSFDARDAEPTAYEKVLLSQYSTFGQKAKAPDTKQYTYVTELHLAVGDFVVVPAAGRLQVAYVRQVDDQVAIEPNSDIKFGWVISKIDMTAALACEARNKQIEEAVAEAYKANLRRGFAQQVMAGLDDTSKERIAALIGGPKA